MCVCVSVQVFLLIGSSAGLREEVEEVMGGRFGAVNEAGRYFPQLKNRKANVNVRLFLFHNCIDPSSFSDGISSV